MTTDKDRSLSVIEQLKANRGIRILYIILAIGLITIILNPIGIPVQTDEYTRSFYNDLKALPDESVVVVQIQCSVSHLPDIQSGSVAVLNLLFQKNVKLVFYSVMPEGPVVLPSILDEVKTSILSENEYGVDYVIFGYVPGQESAIAAFASDIRSVLTEDIHGNSIDDIALMNNINSYSDIGLVIAISGSVPYDEASIRQWVGSYKTNYYVVEFGAGFAVMQPYYPNQIKGMTNGVLGGAQMEILVGIPGEGAKFSDAMSFLYLFAATSIFAGNIMHYIGKGRKTE